MNRKRTLLDCLAPQPKRLRAAIFSGPPTSAIPPGEVHPKVDSNEAPSDFQTGQVQLSSLRPTPVVTQRNDRASLKITNLSAIEIFIFSDPAKTTMYDLLPAGRGNWIAFATKSPVWAMAASDSPFVSFLETYGDGQ